MTQELLPRSKFPATNLLLERAVTCACYAAVAVVWVHRKWAKKSPAPRRQDPGRT